MKSNDWVLIGAGFAFGGVLGAIANAAMLPNKLWLGADGRLQWETLLTGFGAVGAAVATVHFTRRMIIQNALQEEDRRRRRERAARATLPLALTALCDYATQCMEGSERIRGCVDPYGNFDRRRARVVAAEWATPDIPSDAVSVLKECMEYSDDDAAHAMAALMRHLQLHHTRLIDNLARLRSSHMGRIALPVNIDTALVDAAEIYGRCDALFPFARGAFKGAVLPQADHIRRALWIARVDEITCERAYEMAMRWRPRDLAEE